MTALRTYEWDYHSIFARLQKLVDALQVVDETVGVEHEEHGSDLELDASEIVARALDGRLETLLFLHLSKETHRCNN